MLFKKSDLFIFSSLLNWDINGCTSYNNTSLNRIALNKVFALKSCRFVFSSVAFVVNDLASNLIFFLCQNATVKDFPFNSEAFRSITLYNSEKELFIGKKRDFFHQHVAKRILSKYILRHIAI